MNNLKTKLSSNSDNITKVVITSIAAFTIYTCVESLLKAAETQDKDLKFQAKYKDVSVGFNLIEKENAANTETPALEQLEVEE